MRIQITFTVHLYINAITITIIIIIYISVYLSIYLSIDPSICISIYIHIQVYITWKSVASTFDSSPYGTTATASAPAGGAPMAWQSERAWLAATCHQKGGYPEAHT